MSQNYEYEYPPEWDLPEESEPELELCVCCQDVLGNPGIKVSERCQGEFVKWEITIALDRKEEFFCCTECGTLLTEQELITVACEAYGSNWESICYKPVESPMLESWDFTNREDYNHEDVPL